MQEDEPRTFGTESPEKPGGASGGHPTGSAAPEGRPRWVTVLAVVGLVLLVLVVPLLLSGHGPGRHLSGAGTGVPEAGPTASSSTA